MVLGMMGATDLAPSGGNYTIRLITTWNTSGSIPATTSANWSVSAIDTDEWASFATLWKSYRVLGLDAQVSVFLSSSTSGFGAEPFYSTVVRSDTYLSKKDFEDSTESEMHTISTSKNLARREIKMLGVDESTFVETGNTLLIEPIPAIQLLFLDSPAFRRVHFFLRWRVQFRTRV